ncbi:MAG TPA: DUF6259 domain-containing protein [Terriglobia bacterium]|nr:DUF6259 domain-containing protein [Terriglobia bacterium]
MPGKLDRREFIKKAAIGTAGAGLGFPALAAALPTSAELAGYRLEDLSYRGPGEWRISAEPIWVYLYHTLRLRYRASGLAASDAAILTLRPGSVGPVTPGATNPENPFAAGRPVTVVKARDLATDGAFHRLEIELRGKVRTAQIDQLQFSLPAGARLEIEDLEFRGGPEAFPCQAGGPALPVGARKLPATGPFMCGEWPATSLRGRESIRISGEERKGSTVYLSLMAHFAGPARFSTDGPPERWEIKESSEPAWVLARIKYQDGSEEEQFPLLVEERRHVLLNRQAALYALELDPERALASIDLMDRSSHAQLALFAAGISPQKPPAPVESETGPAFAAPSGPVRLPDFSGSAWYRIEPLAGEPAPGAAVRAELRDNQESEVRVLSLLLTNVSREVQEFTLSFPALTISPSARAQDVYYAFPRQGAVISGNETELEADYGARLPLQFVDVFSPSSNSGACLVVRDTDGRGKKFRLKKSQAKVEIGVEYTVRLAPGESLRAPDAQITSHGGDWHEGFAVYRHWLKRWYKPAGPRPAWLRSAFWARRDYPVGGTGLLFDVRRSRYTFRRLIRDGEAFGGIDFIDISGWALSKAAGRVGDYAIQLGGPEDLRQNIAAARQANVFTGLYFEGYLIDKRSRVGRRYGSEWQMIGKNGRGRWWPGGSPELFACPYVRPWQRYLSGRMEDVAKQVGAGGVYLDEYGSGTDRCYSARQGHRPGAETLGGEIEMARAVRRRLNQSGLRDTMMYLENAPPDAEAPYFDAAFSYNMVNSDPKLSPVKLNLWRFAFPDIRVWDMLSVGIDPRPLSADDFRLSLWHGNGAWMKGRADTWYGDDLLRFIRRAHALLKQHAEAFSGEADPLVNSPHPAVFINRFRCGGETVYTLFNASYRTVRFSFLGTERTLAPRGVDVATGA